MPAYWKLELPHTDLIAFSCVAFVRYAFGNKTRRRQLEQAHAALQLEQLRIQQDLATSQLAQLKAQSQRHFLFNTLSSIYGLSLAGSPETARFILLLSELMRYVFYDSGHPAIALPEELAFLENYFELEPRKYAGASIRLVATGW